MTRTSAAHAMWQPKTTRSVAPGYAEQQRATVPNPKVLELKNKFEDLLPTVQTIVYVLRHLPVR